MFLVICLWVQGATMQPFKGKRPAIISTSSLDSDLSLLHQMWPLALIDGSLIVRLWPYVGTVDDSGVYSSFVELLSLPYFDSDDGIIIIIIVFFF